MTKLLPPDTSLKALAKLAGPIWIANIAIVGSGTIDTIMAGHLGKEHLAAIALGIATTISVLMGLVGVLMGLSPIAGHHFGARKFRAIGEELNQSFWLSLVLMAVGVPLLLNTDFWIELGGAKGEVADMAAEFIRWTAFALPASLLGRCFIALNAAVSRPRITMWVSLGMLALMVFAVYLGWFPVGFAAPIGAGAEVSLATRLHHAALPALVLSLTGVANVVLHTREKACEVMESDYVRFARSRGERPWSIVVRHGLRNLALPALTLECAQVSEIIGGSVLVEQVFSYPGLGQAAVTAGLGGDAPLLVGIALATAAVVFAGNLVANVLYGVIDPRMRKGAAHVGA